MDKVAINALNKRVMLKFLDGKQTEAAKMLKKGTGGKTVKLTDIVTANKGTRYNTEKIPNVGKLKSVRKATARETQSKYRLQLSRAQNKPLAITDRVRGK